MPTKAVAESLIAAGLVFKTLQTIFQKVCTILHSYQHCMNDLISLHAHQRLTLSLFFFFNFKYSGKCVVIPHTFLKTNDVEYKALCAYLPLLSSVKCLCMRLLIF